MPNTIAGNVPPFPKLLATIKSGHKCHVFVQDAVNAVFFGKTRNELEAVNISGQGGLKLLQSNGPAEINWEGEIWYLGNAASVAFYYSVE